MKRAFLILLTAMLSLGSTGCVSSKKTSKSELEGHWELNYISGKRIAFEGLYPDKKPHIILT